jgi:hypothetical protein
MQNNNAEVCPITLNSQSQIVARNGLVFKFTEGTKERIYDARALLQCVKRDGTLLNPLTREKFSPEFIQNLKDTIITNRMTLTSEADYDYKSIEQIPKELTYIEYPVKDLLTIALKKFLSNIKNAMVYNVNTEPVTLISQSSESATWSTFFGIKSSCEPFKDRIEKIFGFFIYFSRIKGHDGFILITTVKLTNSTYGNLMIPFVINQKFHNIKIIAKSYCFSSKTTKEVNRVRGNPEYILLVQDTDTELYPNFGITYEPDKISQIAGKPTKLYNGRKYIVRTGSRGGKFILVKNKKIYV